MPPGGEESPATKSEDASDSQATRGGLQNQARKAEAAEKPFEKSRRQWQGRPEEIKNTNRGARGDLLLTSRFL